MIQSASQPSEASASFVTMFSGTKLPVPTICTPVNRRNGERVGFWRTSVLIRSWHLQIKGQRLFGQPRLTDRRAALRFRRGRLACLRERRGPFPRAVPVERRSPDSRPPHPLFRRDHSSDRTASGRLLAGRSGRRAILSAGPAGQRVRTVRKKKLPAAVAHRAQFAVVIAVEDVVRAESLRVRRPSAARYPGRR